MLYLPHIHKLALSMETNKKIIGNAMTAYFMIFVCIFFFLNKDNPNINNTFVKSHTKTAFLLHCLFLLAYILFVSFKIGSGVFVFGFSLNNIIASSLFIFLFAILMYGMYRAYKWQTFTISEMMTLTKTESFVQIDEDKQLTDENKFAIIVSYIPFIGYLAYGKHLRNEQIQDIVFVNLICTSIIAAFYVLWAGNVSMFLSLLYAIFAAFCVVTLLAKDEVIHLNIEIVPTPTEKYLLQKSILSCTYKHIQWKKFTSIKDTYEAKKIKYIADEKIRAQEQADKKDISLPKALIYIPIANFITLGFWKSRYHYHIINGFVVNLLFIVLWAVFGFEHLVPLLTLFPITFGIGYLDRLGYQMPYIYGIYSFFAGIVSWFSHLFTRWREIQKTTQTMSVKVWETPEIQKTQTEKPKSDVSKADNTPEKIHTATGENTQMQTEAKKIVQDIQSQDTKTDKN